MREVVSVHKLQAWFLLRVFHSSSANAGDTESEQRTQISLLATHSAPDSCLSTSLTRDEKLELES